MNPTKIIITGPESSGKTTLAERISSSYDWPLVEEYARIYLNQNGPHYTYEDLLIINDHQQNLEDQAVKKENMIVCDTDWINLNIWAQEKFDQSLPKWEKMHENRFYLLCYPDIPWEEDPFRENPNDRDRLFFLHQRLIQSYDLEHAVIKGPNRFLLAQTIIQSKFNSILK